METKEIEEPYFDEKGIEIKENDLLRVYHFTAAQRRKKHYMYKIATLREIKGNKWWAGKDYCSDHHYWLKAAADKETRVIRGTVIVCEQDWESVRKRIKVWN